MTRIRILVTTIALGLVALAGLTACGATPADAALDTELLGSVLQDPQPAPSDPSGPSARAGTDRKLGRHLLRKAVLHGEVVVKDRAGQPHTVVVQRGEVTAIGADSITVKSSDGFAQTYALTEAVRVVADGRKADLGAVKVGTEVGVAAEKSGGTVTARLIAVPS